MKDSDDPAAARLLLRHNAGRANVVVRHQVETDAVRGCRQGLTTTGEPDPTGRDHRASTVRAGLLLRHRQARRPQELDRSCPCRWRCRRPAHRSWRSSWFGCAARNPLPQLHQRCGVEADGDIRLTASSRIAAVDGTEGRAPRYAGSSPARPRSRSRPRCDQVIDQTHGEPSGHQGDALVGVAVDDVVDRCDRAPSGLARRWSCPASRCNCKRCARHGRPGAFTQPFAESPSWPREQLWLATPGSISMSRSVNPGIVSVG